MFFYIGDQCTLLDKVYDKLFLDKGWNHTISDETLIWYKGYSTECTLSENIQLIINGYKPKGIWSVISYSNNEYTIYHPEVYNFPYNDVTNLYNTLIIDNNKPILSIETNSIDTVVDKVVSLMIDTCSGYNKHNSDVLNIWCTGGLDSVLLLALCEKANIPYNLYAHKSHSANHVEYDSPLISHVKSEFTNYSVMSIFSEKTILGTGYGGDSYFCRHPEQINFLANYLGKTAHDVIKSEHYVAKYLKRPIFNNMNNTLNLSEDETKQRLLDRIPFWHTVWHVDNTIVFTPYQDIDLMKIVLTLPIEVLLDASLDGTIQKKAIEKCNPDFLLLVDKQKNTILGGKNLIDNLNQVKLNHCKKIFIV